MLSVENALRPMTASFLRREAPVFGASRTGAVIDVSFVHERAPKQAKSGEFAFKISMPWTRKLKPPERRSLWTRGSSLFRAHLDAAKCAPRCVGYFGSPKMSDRATAGDTEQVRVTKGTVAPSAARNSS